jgi:hypothetical protein
MNTKVEDAAVEALDNKVADNHEIASASAIPDQGEVFMVEGGDAAAGVEEEVEWRPGAGFEAKAKNGR